MQTTDQIEDEVIDESKESSAGQADSAGPAAAAMFTPVEARILACLMEKELTVPDSYPLTLNSLVLACNQKSNREPVMKLTEGEVGHAARALSDRHFIRIEYRGRTQRLTHKMRLELDIDDKQQALLAIMMLRAPQTLNELKTRTARMAEFDDFDDIQLNLELMNDRYKPLVQHIPPGAGRREERFTHLLCGGVDVESIVESSAKPSRRESSSSPDLEDRVRQLEQRVAALEALINEAD